MVSALLIVIIGLFAYIGTLKLIIRDLQEIIASYKRSLDLNQQTIERYEDIVKKYKETLVQYQATREGDLVVDPEPHLN